MRIPGWFWWAQALGAGVVIALGLALATSYMAFSLPLDTEIGESLSGDVKLALATMIVFLIIGAVISVIAARSLAAWRRRLHALRGDVSAMPLAFPHAPANGAPDVSAEPLVFHWRLIHRAALGHALSAVVSALAVPGYILAVVLVFSDATSHSDPLKFLTAHALLLSVLILCIIGVSVLLALLARVLWFQWRHSFGVTATADGLECLSEYGRHLFIPWGDARFFEAEQSRSSLLSKRTWRLYGSRAVATWDYYPMRQDIVPAGVSAVEMKLRADALAQCITERTRLEPRTLSRALSEPGAPTWRRRLLFIISAISIVTILAVTVAVMVLPLTTTPWVNVAFTLPLLGATSVIAYLYWRFQRRVSGEAAVADSPVRDLAPVVAFKEVATQGQAYALYVGPSRRARVGWFAFGLLIASEVLPFIQGVLAAISSSAGRALGFALSTPLPTTSAAGYLASTLAGGGVIGLIFCFLAIFSHGMVIRADTVGLTVLAGSITFAYLWRDIGEVRESLAENGALTYTIRTRAGATVIRWSSSVAAQSHRIRDANTLPINPAALAQLVRQRIDITDH